MSTDSIGYTLSLLVIGMSFVAVRYRNMLLTLGAAVLWSVLLAYILQNTTAGSNWQSMFILGAGAFIIAFAIISIIGRSRGDQSFSQNIGGLFNREGDRSIPTKLSKGVMDLSNSDYRRYIRSRMAVRRRR